MTPEEAIERTLAALADMPSGPPAEEILAVIQAAAWDEGAEESADHWAQTAHNPNPNGPADPPRNPYRSQA